jgi:hypothetical protein
MKVPIETAIPYETQSAYFLISVALHHGLVLLHVATHMNKTGIGLWHLCDWAGEAGHSIIMSLFEEKLKKGGL